MKQEGREGKAGKYQRSGSFSLLTNKGTEEKGCSKASNLLPQREEKNITQDIKPSFLASEQDLTLVIFSHKTSIS